MSNDNRKDLEHEAARQDRQRRPYKAPTLVEYGSIARLTHSGGSTAREGAVPRMAMSCL